MTNRKRSGKAYHPHPQAMWRPDNGEDLEYLDDQEDQEEDLDCCEPTDEELQSIEKEMPALLARVHRMRLPGRAA